MNHDTFTPTKLEYILVWLDDMFAIRPQHCYLHHLEFGVNLQGLPIPTRRILESLIAYGHQGRQFNNMEVIGVGLGRELSFAQYRLKLYDKALQNGIVYDIFRLEYKASKMKAVEDIFGKHTRLLDLLEPTFWVKCRDRLLKVVDFCIFDDEFGDIKHDKLTTWRNTREWEAMSSTNRSRQRNKFEEFIQQHGTLHIKQTLKAAIENEVREMLAGNA